MPQSPEDRAKAIEALEDAGIDMADAEKALDALYDAGFTLKPGAPMEKGEKPMPFAGKESPEEEMAEAERLGEAGEEMPESYDMRKVPMGKATGIVARFAFGRMKKGAADRKKFYEETEEAEEGEEEGEEEKPPEKKKERAAK